MYLCIDLDAFFVSVEQALNPSLLGKPVVVGGLPGERGVVASASYEARKFGIHSGMPTSQAYRLCPNAIFLKGNFHHYENYSREFHKILNNYSPEVDMVSIDEAYLNIKGTERLFGPPLSLAQKLKNKIRETLNIPTSIGISRTRVFSKIVCNQAKPNGIIMVKPEDELKLLSPLSVDALPGIGPKHLEILKNLNISNVEELIKTSDWVLETALGNYYKILKFFIAGGDFEFHDSMKSISRETTLAEDTINKEIIYALFLYLTERGCNTLREQGLLAKTLTIKVRFSDFKTTTKRTKMTANNAQQIIFEYGARILEELLREKKRVRLIGVCLSNFEYDGLQPSVFGINHVRMLDQLQSATGFEQSIKYPSCDETCARQSNMVREERLKRFNYALDKARAKFGFDTLFPANTLSLRHGNNSHANSKSETLNSRQIQIIKTPNNFLLKDGKF